MWSTLPRLPEASPQGSSRTDRLIRILVPLMVVLILLAIGHRAMALIVAGIAGTLVVATFLSRRVEHRVQKVFGVFGTWVGTALGYLLFGMVYFVVFSLIAIVLRILGRDPLHSRLDPGRATYWTNVAPRVEHPMHRWQFSAYTPLESGSGGGTLRGLLLVVVTTVFLNFLIGAGLKVVGWDKPTRPDPRMQTVALAGEGWVEGYFRELAGSGASRYTGFTGWRRLDFSGEYINIENGNRKSYQPEVQGPAEPFEIFFFGGSTMWGTGNRDLHTIPSEIARLAEADGVSVRVTNFGEIAYVSWQEVILLTELCAAGKVPDLAIFYDGVNDVFVQVQQPTEAPLPQNFIRLNRRMLGRGSLREMLAPYSAVHILVGRTAAGTTQELPARKLPAPAEELAKNAARIHAGSVDVARRLAESYGFEVAAFWQPCVYTKAKVDPGEQEIFDGFIGMDALYDAATILMDKPVIDISDALDTADGPVMIDWCHTNERGAAAVAGAIYRSIRPGLLAAVQGGPETGDSRNAGSRP